MAECWSGAATIHADNDSGPAAMNINKNLSLRETADNARRVSAPPASITKLQLVAGWDGDMNMKEKRWSFFLCVTTLLALAASGVAAPSTVHVKALGETVLTAASKGLTVRVRIKTHETAAPRAIDPYDQESSCTGSRTPCSVVDSLRITVNGKRVFVWRSVFCDLADLNTAAISIEKTTSMLTLKGGDASESYIAKIYFNGENVTRRTVAGGEDPDEITQETKYHLTTLGD